jgi:hypothetical protein
MLDTPPAKRKAKKKRPELVVAKPSLSPDETRSLRDFVYYALGDGHLTAWEENFLNSIKHLVHRQVVWLADKQQAIIRQLKDKLHYDRQDVPLPRIDPDGVYENDDPDGWPVVRDEVDPFQGDERFARLEEV